MSNLALVSTGRIVIKAFAISLLGPTGFLKDSDGFMKPSLSFKNLEGAR